MDDFGSQSVTTDMGASRISPSAILLAIFRSITYQNDVVPIFPWLVQPSSGVSAEALGHIGRKRTPQSNSSAT